MSKGLEALKDIRIRCYDSEPIIDDLETIEKELKALEIIREKRVNIDYLRSCKSLEDYNNILIEKWQLTQEEYDLLKEMLS